MAKAHPPVTVADHLRSRMRLAGALSHVLLAPADPAPVSCPLPSGPRLVSFWPRVEVIDEQSAAVGEDTDLPWTPAGRLLAELHRAGARELSGTTGRRPEPLPAEGTPQRLASAIGAMIAAVRSSTDPRAAAHATAHATVLAAAAAAVGGDYTAWSEAGPHTLVHGDFHLGQLGRLADPPSDDPMSGWRLIDLDDLGTGRAATDLGRPAGFWAAGLLSDTAWTTFLDGYRNWSSATPWISESPCRTTSSDGALDDVPDGAVVGGAPDGASDSDAPAGDPWPVLEVGARLAVVVAGSRVIRSLAAGHEPEADGQALLEVCGRLPTTAREPGPVANPVPEPGAAGTRHRT